MKRAKIKGVSNETKKRRKWTLEAISFTTMLAETAARDVFNATEEQIDEWKNMINYRAKFFVDGAISLDDFRKANKREEK